MALAKGYIQNSNLPSLFEQIQNAKAPDRVTLRLLTDWGFKSKNDRAFIPLLKQLGFLTEDGAPTERYHNYRNKALAPSVLGEAIKEAYEDVFLISENPTSGNRESIEGKFKSYHNTSENLAALMTKTFYSLLELADLEGTPTEILPEEHSRNSVAQDEEKLAKIESRRTSFGRHQFHYNIQIHLPPTKDQEVYNAIFRSLKEHLLDD